VGIGWAGRAGRPALQPTFCTISNALGTNGEWSSTPSADFLVEVNRWGQIGAGFAIAVTGQTLRSNEKHAIWRLIRRCVRRAAGPEAILRSLILAMSFVADRYPRVGRNLMALCMPRVASEHYASTGNCLFVSSGPVAETNTFLYVSRLGSEVQFGPHFAIDGVALLGFRASPPA
jgi:hypothetical protein